MAVVVGPGPSEQRSRARARDRWAARLLRSARDAPRARRPTDLVRLIGGVLVTSGLDAWAAEVHVDRLSPLPSWVDAALQIVVVFCLLLTGVGLIAVTVVWTRWVLLIACVVGAGSAAAATVLVVPSDQAPRLVWLGAATGVVSTAWPELRPLVRRLAVVGLLAAAILAGWGQGSGQHTSVTVIATATALAAGYTLGCAVRLGFGVGTPARLADLVGAYADELGVPLTEVGAVGSTHHWPANLFTARTADGAAATISVYGRDAVDAQILGRIGRFLWYRNSHVGGAYTRVQHLEHHLALVLRASTSGLTDERVLAAGYVGVDDDAAVVTTAPYGRALADHSADELSAELDSIWATVLALTEAGLAHGSIDGTVLCRGLDDPGRWVAAGLSTGSLLPSEQQILTDRAATLVATARIVGVDHAVAAAESALGSEQFAEVIPVLQRGALARTGRSTRAQDKQLLAGLRTRAAAAVHIDPPELAPLHRMDAVTAMLIAGTLLGIWLLIGELAGISNVGDVFKSVEWGWITLAFVVGLLPNITEAIALSGAVAEQLPLGPLIMLRLADGFLGLVGGTVATTAAAIRFFQRRGLSGSIAVTSGLLYSVSGFIDQMIVSLIALVFAHDAFTFAFTEKNSSSGSSGGSSDALWVVLGILVLVGVGSGLAVARPRLRHRVLDKVRPQAIAARDDVRKLAGEPGKLVRLFGANVLTQVLFAITLGLCLRAFGTSASLPVLLLVNTAGSLLGGLAPVPGGMGVIESVLIAGLTAAGVNQDQAIAATFAYRLITAYLPPFWGWPAMWWLRRTDYL